MCENDVNGVNILNVMAIWSVSNDDILMKIILTMIK